MYKFKEDSMKVPAFVWQQKGAVEEGTIEQVKNLAYLPFAFHHIALMPDGHLGYGMPIGGVLATKDYIISHAIGSDIGCGMCAVKTHFQEEITEDTLKKLMGVIRKVVPMGVGKNHKNPCSESQMPILSHTDFVDELINPARYQLGTLGAGNHFIELQRDENNFLWIMLHSGSRKFGLNICNHYDKIARELNKKYFSCVDDKLELAFLPMDSEEGQDYYTDMLYATEFALLNRKKMMYEIMEATQNVVQKYDGKTIRYDGVGDEVIINIHHNYARMEHHYGQNVMVHRKGATSAKLGEIGIIPGSQGTASYIVEGLGNPESFMSCSHGAGRRMGRKAAKRELDLQAEIKRMDDQGILHGMRNVDNLDEAAGAYKDIDTVMEEQKDLVKIIHKLRPIVSLKG